MSQQPSLKQSIVIGALSGALVLSIAAFAIFHFQNIKQTQAISQEMALGQSETLSLPSNETALKELFGATGLSEKASGSIKTAPNKLTSFWFEQSFKLGTDSLHVKFFATQSLDESAQPIESHAQSVAVSAISYKQSASQWRVLSKQLQFGVAGAWGKVNEVKPEILPLSPTSLAVMLDAADGMGGWLQEGKIIFVFARNAWRDVGFVQTGGNNLGTCDDSPPAADDEFPVGPCYSYEGTISVVSGSRSVYPDLLVTRTGTLSEEHRGALIPARNVTYIFKNGKYSE